MRITVSVKSVSVSLSGQQNAEFFVMAKDQPLGLFFVLASQGKEAFGDQARR